MTSGKLDLMKACGPAALSQEDLAERNRGSEDKASQQNIPHGKHKSSHCLDYSIAAEKHMLKEITLDKSSHQHFQRPNRGFSAAASWQLGCDQLTIHHKTEGMTISHHTDGRLHGLHCIPQA